MANYQLFDDDVDTITIKVTNSAGTTKPVPQGDVFTAVSSDPSSLQATIGADVAGNPALVIKPLVLVSPGLSVIISDASGLKSYTLMVDIVTDDTPTNIVLDVANAVHASQPVPTAPGP